MSQKIKLLILGGVLLVVLAAGGLLYRHLSEQYVVTPSEESKTEEKAPSSSTQIAPDFTVLDAKGKQVSLSDYQGKPVVVNFWASWCGPCQSEMPAFEAAAKQYKDEVVFMMINLTDGTSETVESVGQFLKKSGYTFPVYYDTTGQAASVYGVYSIPMTLLIDAKGNLVNHHTGMMSAAALENYIKQIL